MRRSVALSGFARSRTASEASAIFPNICVADRLLRVSLKQTPHRPA
jgi:hypothetical protein